MTLTKDDLNNSLYNQCGFSRTKSVALIETTLELIKSTLESGEDVMLSRFGKFSVRKKKPRRGRNPATGKALMLEARRVVTFHCSPVLSRKLNGKRWGADWDNDPGRFDNPLICHVNLG